MVSIKTWLRFCQIGIFLFIFLYFLATKFYPGGSNADPTAAGFDWSKNYWCELLGPEAKNGLPNPARPIAAGAMFLLCFVLAVFFWVVPQKLVLKTNHKKIVQFSGAISMASALVFLTNWHETATIVSGFFGVVATAGVFFGLLKSQFWGLFWLGVVCLILILANNFIYFTHHFLAFLPVVQKVSFVIFLGWVFGVSRRISWV